MTAQLNLSTPPETTAEKVNAYAKHAVAVAAASAVTLGVLDPATNTIHVSSLHAVYAVLGTTVVSLVLSYCGLGAPAATKTVYLVPNPPEAPPVVSTGISGPPVVLPDRIGPEATS